MDFYDPKLKGLKLLLDDASEAMNWLARQAFGADHSPTVERHDTGHLGEIAQHIDDKLGGWAINALVSATAIDRGTDLVFTYVVKNPRLAPIVPMKGMIKDLLKIGFSTGYRGQSFGDAVTNRALSKYAGVYMQGWMPEIKSIAASAAAQSLRADHDSDNQSQITERNATLKAIAITEADKADSGPGGGTNSQEGQAAGRRFQAEASKRGFSAEAIKAFSRTLSAGDSVCTAYSSYAMLGGLDRVHREFILGFIKGCA